MHVLPLCLCLCEPRQEGMFPPPPARNCQGNAKMISEGRKKLWVVKWLLYFKFSVQILVVFKMWAICSQLWEDITINGHFFYIIYTFKVGYNIFGLSLEQYYFQNHAIKNHVQERFLCTWKQQRIQLSGHDLDYLSWPGLHVLNTESYVL